MAVGNMLRVLRGNQEMLISPANKDKYLKDGYSVISEEGKVEEQGMKSKRMVEDELKTAKKRIAEMESELRRYKEADSENGEPREKSEGSDVDEPQEEKKGRRKSSLS